MNLYLLEQYWNTGYDTYDMAVVCAGSEEEARMMHPSGGTLRKGVNEYTWVGADDAWKVRVTLLGSAVNEVKKGVVCASFNAG